MMRVWLTDLYLRWRRLEHVRRHSYWSRPRCLVAANYPGEGTILAHKGSVSNHSVRRRATAEAADGCDRRLPAKRLESNCDSVRGRGQLLAVTKCTRCLGGEQRC